AANDFATFRGQHGAHARIRRCQRHALPGEFQRLLHELLVSRVLSHQSKSESTKSCGLNGSRSPAFSPTPTYRTGKPSSLQMATTTPPLAVPSSLVSTMP